MTATRSKHRPAPARHTLAHHEVPAMSSDTRGSDHYANCAPGCPRSAAGSYRAAPCLVSSTPARPTFSYGSDTHSHGTRIVSTTAWMRSSAVVCPWSRVSTNNQSIYSAPPTGRSTRSAKTNRGSTPSSTSKAPASTSRVMAALTRSREIPPSAIIRLAVWSLYTTLAAPDFRPRARRPPSTSSKNTTSFRSRMAPGSSGDRM